mgnify:CR=1 FL=1|tara:strand:+ start:2974 stop:4179 length:1206 start_codon:yes stop_codon:yes gene_type:complete
MANTFTVDFPEIWAREQQRVFYKTNVAMKIADISFKSQLSRGDTLNRPYRSSNEVQTYTRGTAITIDDKTDTQEQLSINREFATGFYIDDFDKIQSNYNLIANYAKDDGVYLSNQVDADVLGEVFNATSTVDDGDIGGTSSNGILLTTSNILATVSAAKKKLMKQNIPGNNFYGVISPEFEEILIQYGAGRDTVMGDKLNDNGFITNFYGFKLYRSNQTAGSAVLALATDPTNTDTVVIGGVTFTFVSSIGTTAGNVLIDGTVDTTRASFATLLNDPGTTTATGVALTGSDLRLFQNRVSATNDDTADTLTVNYKGVGVLAVSETLTDATDVWTTALEKQHQLFGGVGNPVLVMQSDARVRMREVQDKLGVNVLNGVLYGVKTYVDNGKAMVNVEIQSSTF